MKFSLHAAAACLSLLALPVLEASTVPATGELPVVGRQLLKDKVDAIVSVEMVVSVKVTMRDRSPAPREQKKEVNGTVISADGLTVVALSTIDPRGSLPPGSTGIRFEDPEYKEVKLRLADNTEIPARIVLQDSDLDLAFIAPEKDAVAGRSFTFIDLKKNADVRILDNCFELLRASKNQQRAPLIRLTSVLGIIEKPRRSILITECMAGCPTLSINGDVVGISVRQFTNGSISGVILLPADDVAEMAKQAAVKALEAPAPAPAPSPAPEVSATPETNVAPVTTPVSAPAAAAATPEPAAAK